MRAFQRPALLASLLCALATLAPPAGARVLSYAPVTGRTASPAVQDRTNRHYLLVETTATYAQRLVLYDSKAIEEPRDISPLGAESFISAAACWEDPGVVSHSRGLDRASRHRRQPATGTPRLLFSPDAGTTWKAVPVGVPGYNNWGGTFIADTGGRIVGVAWLADPPRPRPVPVRLPGARRRFGRSNLRARGGRKPPDPCDRRRRHVHARRLGRSGLPLPREERFDPARRRRHEHGKPLDSGRLDRGSLGKRHEALRLSRREFHLRGLDHALRRRLLRRALVRPERRLHRRLRPPSLQGWRPHRNRVRLQRRLLQPADARLSPCRRTTSTARGSSSASPG